MFVASIPCGPLQANCHIVAPAGRGPCVVIDPGMDAAAAVRSRLARSDLTPVAILATHGHVDHIADAAELAAAYDVAVWIRSEDAHLLTDPAAGLDRTMGAWLRAILPGGLDAPAKVERLDGHTGLELAGLTLTVTHAPGHTAGSVLFSAGDGTAGWVFSGDVLFAGSVGRTDLPGGDPAAMRRTLRDVVLPLDDRAVVAPGHGPRTRLDIERATNPYLQPSFLAGG